jgi:hypothetical protein
LDGSLTTFNGFPFGADNPVNYLEAKRTLRLAKEQLLKNAALIEGLGISTTAGRGAIKSRPDGAVWDYIGLGNASEIEGHTRQVHLTIGVLPEYVESFVTIPNSVKRSVINKLKDMEGEGFRALLWELLREMRGRYPDEEGWVPKIRAVQRRYPYRSAEPIHDAWLEFDLRTAFDGDGLPKYQPVWLAAAYSALIDPRKSNFQLQVGPVFPYETCPKIQTSEAIDLLVAGWLSCRPLIDALCSD